MTDSESANTFGQFKAVCRKGGPKGAQDPFWLSRYFYRPWTIYVSWVLLKLGLTASGASLLSAVAIFAGAFLYGIGEPAAWVAGAICVQVYFVLDHVDGEIGRFERELLGKKTGMSGHFYDTVCHAGEYALYAAMGLRLYIDLGQPWWLLVLIVLCFFPGCIEPWPRYSICVLKHMGASVREGAATIQSRFLYEDSWATPQVEGVGPDAQSPSQKWLGFFLQLIGFPGFFVTLLLCTLLDYFPAVPKLTIGDTVLPYLLLWFAMRALHRTASSLKSTFVYAARLRQLKSS